MFVGCETATHFTPPKFSVSVQKQHFKIKVKDRFSHMPSDRPNISLNNLEVRRQNCNEKNIHFFQHSQEASFLYPPRNLRNG
jgi:hypothetical protein